MENKSLQTTGKDNSQLVGFQHSTNLINSIKLLAATDAKGNPIEAMVSKGNLDLISVATGLMPNGVVDFNKMYEYTPIKNLEKEIGVPATQTLIFLLIANFCKSFNVVRNMTEDQMIECAVYLLEECRDFRMEDYVIMFTMGKRGRIGKVMDHIDIEVISEMHHEYLAIRQSNFRKINEAKRAEEIREKHEELKQQDPNIAKEAFNKMRALTDHFINLEAIEDKRQRDEVIAARDRQIVELIERDAQAGIAPDKYLREYYYNYLQRHKS